MPDIVLHYEVGVKVLEHLDNRIKSGINHKVFKYGLMVPDAYMSYRFFTPHFRHGVNKRGAIMHERMCNKFLVKLSLDELNVNDFSVLCGVICHYAVDSTMHPLINKIAQDRPEIHEAMEHALDVRELNRKGLSIAQINHYFAPYYDCSALRDAIREVYGWDGRYLKASYRHMQFYYNIAADRLGLINLLFQKAPGRLSSISYKNKKCCNQDLGIFDTLIEEAIEKSVSMISALVAYQNGEIGVESLSSTYGNLTYTGVPEEM